MNAREGGMYQMGAGAYELSVQHPMSDPEGAEAVNRLGGLLGQFRQRAAEQHEAEVTARAIVQRQRELRLIIARIHLLHLASVGRLAARDLPELARTFSPRKMKTILQFRTVTGAILEATRANQDVLRKHGLSVTMVDDLEKGLAEYDSLTEALHRHQTGRVGATTDLHRVAKDIVAVVRVLDGHNRFRWRDDAKMLAAWQKASTIRAESARAASDSASPADGTGSAGADRPAA